MLDAIGAAKAKTAPDWGAASLRRFRLKLARRKLPAPCEGRMLPQTMLASLRENTPEDIMLTTDVGSHKIFAALEWPARKPNRYFVSNGLSAMGFGLSSAIAAAEIGRGAGRLHHRRRRAWRWSMGELGLLAERRLPVLDRADERWRAGPDSLGSIARRGRPAFGTEFAQPGLRMLMATSLRHRLSESRVARLRLRQEAIRAGLAWPARAPMLIDVMIDPVGYPTTVAVRNRSLWQREVCPIRPPMFMRWQDARM